MIFIEWEGSVIVETLVEEPQKWSSELLEQFVQNRYKSVKSHKIRGRWENQYLEIDTVPSARKVMRQAREIGKNKLGITSIVLYESPCGSQNPYPPFWFNVAAVGEITGLHDHAHLSSLSGVVYLQAGEGCGELYFRKEGVDDLNIRPEVGKLVLFPPFLKHGVHSNKSTKERISFAFNLFPFPLTIPK